MISAVKYDDEDMPEVLLSKTNNHNPSMPALLCQARHLPFGDTVCVILQNFLQKLLQFSLVYHPMLDRDEFFLYSEVVSNV